MLLSTTVVSTRIRRPATMPLSCAILTIRSWICLSSWGSTPKPYGPMVLASGILPPATRVSREYEVGANLSLHSVVAQVPDVLENQQA
jgi:hypothetical protein